MSKIMIEVESMEAFAKWAYVRDIAMGGFPDGVEAWDYLKPELKQAYIDEAITALGEDQGAVLLDTELDAVIEYLSGV